jgi:hypothetical protein
MAHRAFRVRDASRVPFHPHIARRRMPYIYHGFCRRVHMSSAPICWRSKTLHAISTRAHALPQVTGAWHAWSAFRCLCARRPLRVLRNVRLSSLAFSPLGAFPLTGTRDALFAALRPAARAIRCTSRPFCANRTGIQATQLRRKWDPSFPGPNALQVASQSPPHPLLRRWRHVSAGDSTRLCDIGVHSRRRGWAWRRAASS